MPLGTPSNAANVTFSIDGSNIGSSTVDNLFIQRSNCKDVRIVFQTQKGQIQPGNHTLEVVYHGDDTKMPLTLCGLAATPPDFSALDVQPPTSSSLVAPSSTTPPSTTPSISSPTGGNEQGKTPSQKSHTIIVTGIICGATIALIVLFVTLVWWRRRRVKQEGPEKMSDPTGSIFPFSYQPVFGSLATYKRSSAVVESRPASPTAPLVSHKHSGHNGHSTETSQNSSRLESRPPSYYTTRLPSIRSVN